MIVLMGHGYEKSCPWPNMGWSARPNKVFQIPPKYIWAELCFVVAIAQITGYH